MAEGPDGGAPGATVVVAGADAQVCEIEARILEAAGHQAARVTDPAGVADAVVRAGASVAVLDVGAANVDTLRALRAHHDDDVASVRAVVIGTGPASARMAWQEGADEVLARPFPASALVESVATVLGRLDHDRATARTEARNRLSPA